LAQVGAVLIIAAKYDLKLDQMDLDIAILGVDWEVEIYMHSGKAYIHLIYTGSQYNNPRLTYTSWKLETVSFGPETVYLYLVWHI
jgi:hypothetical protein